MHPDAYFTFQNKIINYKFVKYVVQEEKTVHVKP